MVVSRLFWKTAGGAFHRPAASCRQPYGDTGRSGTLVSASGLRVAGGNGAGVAMVAMMVAMHDQAATVAEGLVVIQGLLEGGLQLGGDSAFQLGFQVV